MQRTAVIVGKVVDRDCKELIIRKVTDDIRNYGEEISIDENRVFIYHMSVSNIEAYDFIFKDEFINEEI